MTKKKVKVGFRPKKKKKLDGKRCIRINKKTQADFLSALKDKLEEDHIKRYTFIVKGSKMYTAGVFWSEKNKRKYVFRSTYEFAFFYQLEDDPEVISYQVEPFEIPYLDPKYKNVRIYKPDVIVYYKNEVIKLLEIKPKRKLRNFEVRAKAEGAKNWLKINMPDVTYHFVTEDEIFKNPQDYMKLLGQIDPEKYQRRLARSGKREQKKLEKPEVIETNTKRGFNPSRKGAFGGSKNAATKQEIAYVKSVLPKELKYSPFILI